MSLIVDLFLFVDPGFRNTLCYQFESTLVTSPISLSAVAARGTLSQESCDAFQYFYAFLFLFCPFMYMLLTRYLYADLARIISSASLLRMRSACLVRKVRSRRTATSYENLKPRNTILSTGICEHYVVLFTDFYKLRYYELYYLLPLSIASRKGKLDLPLSSKRWSASHS